MRMVLVMEISARPGRDMAQIAGTYAPTEYHPLAR